MNSEEVKALIIEGVEAALRDKGMSEEVTGDFHLFGSGSVIDSLDLVGIVVGLEETIRDKTGNEIEIVDETAIVSAVSPFRSVDSMTDHVMSKLAG